MTTRRAFLQSRTRSAARAAVLAGTRHGRRAPGGGGRVGARRCERLYTVVLTSASGSVASRTGSRSAAPVTRFRGDITDFCSRSVVRWRESRRSRARPRTGRCCAGDLLDHRAGAAGRASPARPTLPGRSSVWNGGPGITALRVHLSRCTDRRGAPPVTSRGAHRVDDSRRISAASRV